MIVYWIGFGLAVVLVFVAGLMLGAQFTLTQVAKVDMHRLDPDMYPAPDPEFAAILAEMVAQQRARQNGRGGVYAEFRRQYNEEYGSPKK